ncbi:MAG: hypothetical protein GKR99_17180 [Rhodobacteraceae bacterium]|nr:hypothetical protein [Paracoccaceae bacterium]
MGWHFTAGRNHQDADFNRCFCCRMPGVERHSVFRSSGIAIGGVLWPGSRSGAGLFCAFRPYDRYLQRGEAGLQDQSSRPKHVWNRIPVEVRRRVVKLALKETELSPRELAVTLTDNESYFVSEASTYRILTAHDLITSPAFIVIKAASEFKDKTTAINQRWQTDFTYLKVLGWGWFDLSTNY